MERQAWMPNERSELLIRAAVGTGSEALTSWRAWKGGLPVTTVPGPDMNILPLAARNIMRLDPEDPDLERLKGLLRFTWSQNQVLLDLGGRAISLLSAEGIDAIVLKGASLSLLYYRDLSVRPMVDFDVLVPRESAAQAIDALLRVFSPDPRFPDPHARIPVHHSVSLADGERDLDLHWYALWQSSPDDDFWEASTSVEVAGQPARALSPPDQLLQLCVHGAHWAPEPTLRWVADAATVIGRTPTLDWGRLTSQAEARQVTAVLADALGYLREGLGVAVPAEVVGRLRAVKASRKELVARRAWTRPLTGVGVLRTQWERYARLRELDPSAPRAPSFPAQLRDWLGFDSYRQLLRFGAGRTITRRRRALARDR